MVQFKNVKATVIRYDDKKPYHEYKLTQNGTRRGQTLKEAYVEIVPGERFAVVVDIGIAFGFSGGPDARIRCSVDGMRPTSFYVSEKNVTDTYTAASLSWRRRTWEHGAQKVDGKWVKCPLVFAELQHDETAEPSAGHAAQEADTRGKITVEIQCGTLVRIEPRPKDKSRISEAASTSTGIINKTDAPSTVKPLKLGEGVPGDHTWTEHKFTAARGRFNTPLRLNLIYRSRSALEQLQIIPKSSLAPNPIASPSAIGDRVSIAGTVHGASNLPLDVSNVAEQPGLTEQRAPGSPRDVSDGAEKPQPEDLRAPDLPPIVIDGTEQPQPEEQNLPALPSDVGINAGEETSKKQSAPDPPLDIGGNSQQPPPGKHSAPDSALNVDYGVQQPPPKKTKKETSAHDLTSKAGIKREHIKSEEKSKHKDQISAGIASPTYPGPLPSVNQEVARPSPIVIKDEDEDEELVIVSAGPVSRVSPTGTQAQDQVSVAPAQREDQAKRERKKAILKKRLEQLKIEQELLEMED